MCFVVAVVAVVVVVIVFVRCRSAFLRVERGIAFVLLILTRPFSLSSWPFLWRSDLLLSLFVLASASVRICSEEFASRVDSAKR